MENMLSGLEKMVVYDLIVVLKHLTKKDKMSLRASSTTMLRRINELENTFKVWRIYTGDSINLRKMADEICYIQGIKYFAIFQPSSKLSWGGGAFNHFCDTCKAHSIALFTINCFTFFWHKLSKN